MRGEKTVEHWLAGVCRVLARAPTCTLPFSEVLEGLSMEATGPLPEPGWLLSRLTERTDLFRVLSIAVGPWADWREASRPGGTPLRARRRQDDPWILLLRGPETGFGAPSTLSARVREGLMAWGQSVDDASPSELARWLRASLEGSRLCEALVRSPGTVP